MKITVNDLCLGFLRAHKRILRLGSYPVRGNSKAQRQAKQRERAAFAVMRRYSRALDGWQP